MAALIGVNEVNTNQVHGNCKYTLLLFFVVLLTLPSLKLSVKPQAYESQDKIVNDKSLFNNLNTECVIINTCNECSFDQLKTSEICEKSGYIQIKKCGLYDVNNNFINQKVYYESCEGLSYRVNSVHKLLIFCIILFIVCFVARRKEKSKIASGSTLNKYKIIKTT